MYFWSFRVLLICPDIIAIVDWFSCAKVRGMLEHEKIHMQYADARITRSTRDIGCSMLMHASRDQHVRYTHHETNT